ncbi:putative TIM-barrel fold metal-dependent hydrolase [Galbibacter orientalis DSM 19592]|uniref:Putative TIM-barrel fold metal-dependent hydrolase n=1 Tax=Galbibacter orientalis DSM 19592 TaxID=926559 RepID=I3CAW5_9FLAO|nr:amidohydrolase family protein [Galbibacter orientalis]EIJ40758.1 putative TIM-barrel fold metal-dependent hydrolase [Galbibacter orientalis DSM 19592]
MIIDSHQHFWQYEVEKHSWIDDSMKTIRRDFLPADLKPIYKQNDVEGCVAVQADQTLEENDFLLDLAKKNSFIKGIVGWLDLQDKKVTITMEKYASETLFKGVRHIIQGEDDPNFILRESFNNGISLLEKNNLTYDILVYPHQLGATLEFVEKFPNQKFVIDHIAKPYIKDGYYSGWSTLIKAISKHENVYCKLSGMVTEADYNNWSYEQITPYMELILESFGPKRIMFGSDWPVCLVAGNYTQIKDLVSQFIARLSPTEQAAFWSTNAIKFYNL